MRKLLGLFVGLMVVATAVAHDPQLSGIGIAMQSGRATIAVQAHLAKLSTSDPGKDLAARLALNLNGQPFVAARPEVLVDKVQGVVYWRASYSAEVRSFEVERRLFPEDPASRTVVSVTKDGVSLQETLLDAAHPALRQAGERRMGARGVMRQFLSLGVMHIFTGPDHILFILGLILLGGGLKAILKTVTAFTLAHSITLSVAATGLWSPPSRFVEPLIALSIVAVAFENLRARRGERDWRPLIAFGFGLIHGFGFAGGLSEAGLPAGALGWALASFNIGVECAQASIVLLVTPVLAWLAGCRPRVSRQVVLAGSVGIAVAGAGWFLQRVGA